MGIEHCDAESASANATLGLSSSILFCRRSFSSSFSFMVLSREIIVSGLFKKSFAFSFVK
jgi:hypothetical protein